MCHLTTWFKYLLYPLIRASKLNFNVFKFGLSDFKGAQFLLVLLISLHHKVYKGAQILRALLISLHHKV